MSIEAINIAIPSVCTEAGFRRNNSCNDTKITNTCLPLDSTISCIIISLSTCAVIGQFSSPYSPVRPAKI